MPKNSPMAVRWIVGLLLVVFGVYLIVVPLSWAIWEAIWAPPQQPAIRRLNDEMDFADWFRLKAVEAAMAAIFFAVGASIGSFLNVVVYRLPAGVPLFLRRSHCPKCRRPIAARDNLPLLGWIRLGGRCRSCGDEISVRYPLIEGLMGSVFLLLFAVQLISGGWNLPNRIPNLYTGVVWVLFYTKWDLVGLYFYHCLLFAMLLVVGMVDYDRRHLTWRQIGIGWLGLAAVAVVRPELLLWKWQSGVHPSLDAGLTVGLGTLCGLALGLVGGGTRGWIAGLAWIGAALGWQAVVGISAITLAVRVVGAGVVTVSQRRDGRPQWMNWPTTGTLSLFAVALLHHLAWRWLTVTFEPYWPGAVISLPVLGVWVIGATVLLLANRYHGRSPQIPPNSTGPLASPPEPMEPH